MSELERLILKHQTPDERTPDLAPLTEFLIGRYGNNIEAIFFVWLVQALPCP